MEEQCINFPIGFMDSGLGGLSVLREAVRLMPQEDFIYYGDSANAPYGTKSPEEVQSLTFAVVEKLLAQGIKGLTIACNTATASAVSSIREAYPSLAVVGIEPAVKPAVESGRGGRILVMATPITLTQNKFHELVHRFDDQAEIVPVPCPGLMEFVEEGSLSGDALDAYLHRTLDPWLSEDTESIVLGCTHYPFLKRELKSFLSGRPVALIDGSRGTAAEMRRRLKVKGLLRSDRHKGSVIIENSLPGDEMLRRSNYLLNIPYEYTD